MSTNENFPQTGILIPDNEEKPGIMSELTHAILDDIFYNIIHDICLKTHREEKIAKASSAAIIVEQKAADTDPNSSDSGSVNGASAPHRVETAGAIYNNGEVYLKGNPLKTTTEIRCPKCGLPRLLHPTDGNGARKPEPGVEYCKKRPFIEKAYHDIYGQTYVPEGPGRGKKKKDMVNPLKVQQAKEGTPTGSQDSPNGSPPPNEGPAKPIAFPHAKCHHCNTFLPIKRMNNHMAKCIGGGGRDSSRNALWKIQNGNGASQNGNTPPSSRNGTPVPGGKEKGGRTSPNKRSPGDDFESDSPIKKKKVLLKKTVAGKLKAPKMAKAASQHSTSNLSFESKVPNSEDEDEDEGEDERDGEYGATIAVEPKKKLKLGIGMGNAKKLKDGGAGKKKWLHGKGGVKPNLPPIDTAEVAKGTAESESSQTLSSPN